MLITCTVRYSHCFADMEQKSDFLMPWWWLYSSKVVGRCTVQICIEITTWLPLPNLYVVDFIELLPVLQATRPSLWHCLCNIHSCKEPGTVRLHLQGPDSTNERAGLWQDAAVSLLCGSLHWRLDGLWQIQQSQWTGLSHLDVTMKQPESEFIEVQTWYGCASSNQHLLQINLYLLSRVIYGFVRMAMQYGYIPDTKGEGFPWFAAIIWGIVLWQFEYHKAHLQPSLQSSMTYLYHDSNTWHNIRDFLIYNK